MTHRWNKHSYAHEMVAHLQVEMAHEVFETKSSTDNVFHKEWKDKRGLFVNAIAPSLRDAARGTFAELLGRHDVSEKDKRDIYDALLKDRDIPNEDRWTIQ